MFWPFKVWINDVCILRNVEQKGLTQDDLPVQGWSLTSEFEKLWFVQPISTSATYIGTYDTTYSAK